MNDLIDFIDDNDIYKIKNKVVELHTIKVYLDKQLIRIPK